MFKLQTPLQYLSTPCFLQTGLYHPQSRVLGSLQHRLQTAPLRHWRPPCPPKSPWQSRLPQIRLSYLKELLPSLPVLLDLLQSHSPGSLASLPCLRTLWSNQSPVPCPSWRSVTLNGTTRGSISVLQTSVVRQ